jgi:CRP/FNR family cyclic AMP-dependent transcriptional regulator
MPCDPEALKHVPLFSLLDSDERAVLAAQVELKTFAIRQRIYKRGDPGERAYVMVSGIVRVSTIDEDHQEVVVDEPKAGEFFGFASMLDQTPHQTDAIAAEESVCLEIDRHDLQSLFQQKPHAAMDVLASLGRQFHASQALVRGRTARNPNLVIEEEATFGETVADSVARFGGSWAFIISFGVILVSYTSLNRILGSNAWDPYPFILLNLFLSMLAAIQAPVIMMSQNRQDKKDRVRGELDYEVNLRAEAEIKSLAQKMNLIGDQMADLKDLVRDNQPRHGTGN